MPAASPSGCRSARCIRPTSPPTRKPGSAITAMQDFLNAVHRGIRHDGARLYPAMPYTSYTYMTDADALAIKAYLFSLPPVHAPAPENTLSFPFNQRWAMTFWSAVFNRDSRFAPDTSKSPEWNRGAYLAEALAHCGECHTPRNLAFALDNRRKFAGAMAAGWRAYNITSDKATGIGGWADDDLVSYLVDRARQWPRHGFGADGRSGRAQLHIWCGEDIRALVGYLRSVPPITSPDCRRRSRRPRPPRTRRAALRRRAARWCSKAPASVATAGPAKVRSRRSPRSPARGRSTIPPPSMSRRS